MEFFCITNLKLTKEKEKTIQIMYPDIQILKGLDNLNKINKGDTIIFDNVLELDKNNNNDIDTIINCYCELLNKGIELKFSRSPNCDSSQIKGINIDFREFVRININAYIMIKDASKSIKRYAQLKALDDPNKSYGRPIGVTSETEKAKNAKKVILANSKDFNGNLSDIDCIKISGASRKMYYIYKKQLKEEQTKKAG